jgi:CubicO group peptidase (beta-lactamase class C family)
MERIEKPTRTDAPLLVVGQPTGHRPISCHRIAFSSDGHLLEFQSDGMLRVSDAATGKAIRHVKLGPARKAAFSTDGGRLATLRDHSLTVYDTSSGREVRRLKAADPWCLTLSPDDRLLACAAKRSVKIWELASGRVQRTLMQRVTKNWSDREGIETLDFSPDGKRLAAAFSNGVVSVWEVAKGELIFSRDIYFAPGSHTDRRSPLPRLGDGRSGQAAAVHGVVAALTMFQTWDMGVAACRVAFSRDARRLAWIGGEYDEVRMLDASKGTELARLVPGQLLAFSPDGRRLAIATPRDEWSTSRLRADGKWRLDTSKDRGGKLVIWDAIRNRQIRSIAAGFDNMVQDLVYSPDGCRVASAHRDGTIKVWDALAPSADLPRSSPEAQGVSSAAVLSFVETAEKTIDSMNSFMLLRHGHVLAEGWWSPYEAASPHSLYSLSKSFTSTAVGLAISEGRLSLDDEVLKFFPENAPAEPSSNLKAMRVSDLLRMSTGHQTEPKRTPEEPWTRTFLLHPVPFKPGTHFLYNTSATYMLSAIVQKVTGMTVLDYLKPRLFEPLGIDHPTWDASPQGITIGGYGLSIRTEDIARFGQLYLQKGKWQGKQLIPEAWVEAATARQTSNGSNPKSDWDQGYGYQFWRCRHGGYRGDGAFGQFCIVLPEQDAVIAITSGVRDMQAVLNLVWDKLLPPMQSAQLAADDASLEKLRQKPKGLSLPPQAGSASPAKVSSKKYLFPSNDRKLEWISLVGDRKGEAVTLVAHFAETEQRIACARGKWQPGRAAWDSLHEQPMAASGGWAEDNTFTAKLCFYQTPFTFTVKLKFSGAELRFNSESNVGFGSTKQSELVGKAE